MTTPDWIWRDLEERVTKGLTDILLYGHTTVARACYLLPEQRWIPQAECPDCADQMSERS